MPKRKRCPPRTRDKGAQGWSICLCEIVHETLNTIIIPSAQGDSDGVFMACRERGLRRLHAFSNQHHIKPRFLFSIVSATIAYYKRAMTILFIQPTRYVPLLAPVEFVPGLHKINAAAFDNEGLLATLLQPEPQQQRYVMADWRNRVGAYATVEPLTQAGQTGILARAVAVRLDQQGRGYSMRLLRHAWQAVQAESAATLDFLRVETYPHLVRPFSKLGFQLVGRKSELRLMDLSAEGAARLLKLPQAVVPAHRPVAQKSLVAAL